MPNSILKINQILFIFLIVYSGYDLWLCIYVFYNID